MNIIRINHFNTLISNIFIDLCHFFLPRFCIICQTTQIETDTSVCKNCWSQIPAIDRDEYITNIVHKQIQDDCYFNKSIVVWSFSPEVQTIIHYLKYMDFRQLAKIIGKAMGEKLIRFGSSPKDTILIPVPLHRTRIRERGYNQSELLCQAIYEATGLPFSDNILKRIRYTQSQTRLTAKERHQNVAGAFKAVSKKELNDKTIFLVDDVLTTGATMNSCAKELFLAGAKNINLLAAVKA